MTARFAGSRTLDERRRRWLASHETEQPSTTRPRKTGEDPGDSAEPARVQITHFPVRKIISPKGWKIALVAVVSLLAGASLVAAAYFGSEHAESLGPGWQRLFPVSGGGLVRLFEAGLLILSGQLAWLVWWLRARSLRDFDGQYHVWLWASVAVMFTGLGWLGGWHWAWSETFCWLSTTDFPQRAVLCWLLPGTLAGGVIWKKLRADMRDCQSSSVLFWMVGVCFLGACAFRLRLDHAPWPETTRQLVGSSLQMLTCVGVFAAFLVHARFVLHVSLEAPAARPSILSKMRERILVAVKKLPKPRFSLAWISLPKFPKRSKSASTKAKPTRRDKKAKTEKTVAETSPSQSEPSSSEEGTQPESSSKPVAPKTSRRKPTKSRTKSKPTEEPQAESDGSSATEQPESKLTEKSTPQARAENPKRTPAKAGERVSNESEDATDIPESKPKDSSAAKPEPSKEAPAVDDQESSQASDSSEPHLRLDEPLDPEMLKGLSKKERRRLRKLHKDAQRKK